MFDQKEIIRRVCRTWVRKGELTQKEWGLLQARAASKSLSIEEELLSSTHITEKTLLEGLRDEMGCRLWQGLDLLQHVTRYPSSNPLPSNLLLEHKMILLRWSPEEGILHIAMPRLPTLSLFRALKSVLTIHKLHFELGTTDSINSVLSLWYGQEGNETIAYNAGKHSDEQLNQIFHDTSPQAFAGTGASAPFDMPTIRQAPKEPIDESQTFMILPMADVETSTDLPDASAGFSYTGDGPTDYQAPPSAYPASDAPFRPQDKIETLEDEPAPSFLQESNFSLAEEPLVVSDKKREDMVGHILSTGQEIKPLHSMEQPSNEKTPAGLLDVSDDDFFLDYSREEKPNSDESIISDDEWSVSLPPRDKKKEPEDVIDLLELVDSFELEPKPTKQPVARQNPKPKPIQIPSPAPPEKKSIFGDSILPSDEELFGSSAPSLSSKPKQNTYQVRSNPPNHIQSPVSPMNQGRKSAHSNKVDKKGKRKAEDFALTYVLGGFVTVLNIALRVGFAGVILYMIWFFFLSK